MQQLVCYGLCVNVSAVTEQSQRGVLNTKKTALEMWWPSSYLWYCIKNVPIWNKTGHVLKIPEMYWRDQKCTYPVVYVLYTRRVNFWSAPAAIGSSHPPKNDPSKIQASGRWAHRFWKTVGHQPFVFTLSLSFLSHCCLLETVKTNH